MVAHEYRKLPGCEKTANIFTIHNMAFQGRFHRDLMGLTGIDWSHFNFHEMESYGDLNLLKTGIVFADAVTTVSPTYAREITRPEFGYGLEGTLSAKFDRLMGVLNGVDTSEWNPKIDPHIPQNYDATSVEAGKRACKAALQAELGLDTDPHALLFGMVSRMADQKGFDLVAARIEEILKANVQFAFLGTGDRRYEDLVRRLAEEHPDQISATLQFDEGLAHRIEAASDAYLMPSRFEPCGLNQQYSLMYGAVPIVHRTGGLADTVIDTRPSTIADGTANGFVFDSYDPNSFLTSVWQCVGCYQHDKLLWARLIQNGMRVDRSWKRSAAEYEEIYRRTIAWLGN